MTQKTDVHLEKYTQAYEYYVDITSFFIKRQSFNEHLNGIQNLLLFRMADPQKAG